MPVDFPAIRFFGAFKDEGTSVKKPQPYTGALEYRDILDAALNLVPNVVTPLQLDDLQQFRSRVDRTRIILVGDEDLSLLFRGVAFQFRQRFHFGHLIDPEGASGMCIAIGC